MFINNPVGVIFFRNHNVLLLQCIYKFLKFHRQRSKPTFTRETPQGELAGRGRGQGRGHGRGRGGQVTGGSGDIEAGHPVKTPGSYSLQVKQISLYEFFYLLQTL